MSSSYQRLDGNGHSHGHSHDHSHDHSHSHSEESAKSYGSVHEAGQPLSVVCSEDRDGGGDGHREKLLPSSYRRGHECGGFTGSAVQRRRQKRGRSGHSHGNGSDGHGHSHGGGGKEMEEDTRVALRKLYTAATLCGVFMVAEAIGGFYANSLSVMTDAAHLLTDLAGFLISIVSLHMATREPTSRLSFGFHRAEILGALVSVALIWALTGVLLYEGVRRVLNPSQVKGELMFFIALGGLCVNLIMGIVLHQSGHTHSHGALPGSESHGHSHSHGHGHSHGGSSGKNLNVSAAFIHVVGDAIQSVGVMIAGALIWYNPDWRLADPCCTFLFSVLVLLTTFRLVKQSVGVLMEGVPDGIDPEQVVEDLESISGVECTHDLHIWSLSMSKPALSVHVLVRDPAVQCEVLREATRLCHDRYRINHTTIQVEVARNRHDHHDKHGDGYVTTFGGCAAARSLPGSRESSPRHSRNRRLSASRSGNVSSHHHAERRHSHSHDHSDGDDDDDFEHSHSS